MTTPWFQLNVTTSRLAVGMAVPSICLSLCLSICNVDDSTFVQYFCTVLVGLRRKHYQSVRNCNFSDLTRLSYITFIMNTYIFDSFVRDVCVFSCLENYCRCLQLHRLEKNLGRVQMFGSRSLFDALNIELWKEKNSECSS